MIIVSVTSIIITEVASLPPCPVVIKKQTVHADRSLADPWYSHRYEKQYYCGIGVAEVSSNKLCSVILGYTAIITVSCMFLIAKNHFNSNINFFHWRSIMRCGSMTYIGEITLKQTGHAVDFSLNTYNT